MITGRITCDRLDYFNQKLHIYVIYPRFLFKQGPILRQ